MWSGQTNTQHGGYAMTGLDTMVVLAARYDSERDAVADYNAVVKFLNESGAVDTYDAAVVSRKETGKVKIVMKREEPTRHGAIAGLGIGLAAGLVVALFPAVAIGGSLLVGGAGGAAVGALAGHVARGMSRSDLKDLGELLDDGESGVIVVAATDVADRVDALLAKAAKKQRKQMAADEKELKRELANA